jgi:hypothetical protein
MKLSDILPLVVGSAAAILASTSPAHALDFNFTFTGDPSYPGEVSGTIYGLLDNATSAATGVEVTLLNNGTTNLPVIVQWFYNTFTVTGGVVTAANFHAQEVWIGDEMLDLTLNGWGTNYFDVIRVINENENELVSIVYNEGGFAGATYTSATTAAVPLDIPGGATIPSVGALLALGAMRKARKSLASKTRLANPVCASVS